MMSDLWKWSNFPLIIFAFWSCVWWQGVHLLLFQAMAYNAKILSNQEKAMDEYLRRQRAEQIYSKSSSAVRLQDPFKMPLTGMVPSSTPATPTGRRRNNNSGSRNGSPSRYKNAPHLKCYFSSKVCHWFCSRFLKYSFEMAKHIP